MISIRPPLEQVDLPFLHSGKVRDIWDFDDKLLMVTSDRISAFDVVLPTPIPGKGIILNQLSTWWFRKLGNLVPNHLVTADFCEIQELAGPLPESFQGRSIVARKADRIDVECVVRGYLAGSGWAEYQRSGTVGFYPGPSGLLQSERLLEPLFTPASKNDIGHDENISYRQLETEIGTELADRLRTTSLTLYDRASAIAEAAGLLIADTKFEFGFVDGELTLIDELLTPDSSRFWDSASYQPGYDQAGFDKQFVRNWLLESNWDKNPPGPTLPDEVVLATRRRYLNAYERLTGYRFEELT